MKTSPVLPATPETDPLKEKKEKKEKMMEAAKKFESYFVGFVFEKAYEAVPKSDLFDGKQQEMFTGMFIQNLSDQLAKAPRGIGLADQIYKEMERKENLSETVNRSLRESLGRDMGTDLAQLRTEGLKNE